MGYINIQNAFEATDNTGTLLLYTDQDHQSEPVVSQQGATYTIYAFDEYVFDNVKVMDSNGNIYYTDYSQLTANKDSDDVKFTNERWGMANRIDEENAEMRQRIYDAANGYTTTGSLTDEDGDEIVGPHKTSVTTEADYGTTAIVKTYGIPPQWTKYVDPRVYAFKFCYKNNSPMAIMCSLGRRFFEVTISRPTIVAIAPGRVYYPTKGLGAKEDYAKQLDMFNNGNPADIIGDDKASFFTIKPCYNDSPDGKIRGYISYVSVLMRVFAVFLSRNVASTAKDTASNSGIHYYSRTATSLTDIESSNSNIQFSDRKVPVFGGAYKDFTWHLYDGEGSYSNENPLFNFAAVNKNGEYGLLNVNSSGYTEDGFTYIRFFALNGSRSSDTFDTQIDDTQMAGAINQIGNGMKDAAFFISGVIGNELSDNIDDATEKLKEFANGSTNGGMFSALLDATAEVVRGGKIMFPKVISDCDYGKSMSMECVFTSIYGAPESIYLNGYSGLAHILALALPHQVRSSIDIYTYPYIVKAFCKGVFSCPMGVVTGMTVDYAGESGDMWSTDSVPTEIKVSFQITPLISKLAMTSENDSTGWLLRNNGLQEYIATIAGADLRGDKVELASELLGIMLNNLPAKTISNAIQRKWDEFFTTTTGRFALNVYNYFKDNSVSDMMDTIL